MPSVLDTTAWPAREHICLRCRQLLSAWGACSCGSEEIVELHGSRRQLVDRVWGPLAGRDAVNRPAAAMMLVGGLTLGVSLLIVNGAGLLFGFGSLTVGGLVRLVQVGRQDEDRRARMTALPAESSAPLLPGPSPFGGRVVTDRVCRAPMSMRYCVAFATELRDGRAHDIFLRDSVTIGFQVAGNDGRTVDVPPGPIQIAGGASRRIQLEEQIRAYLITCDPGWRPDRYDPFPYATAFEAVVCEGDTLELHNELEPVHDTNTPVPGYRESATSRLRVVGTPRIRIA